MDIGGGRRIPYPPVRAFIDHWGWQAYEVQLRYRTEIIIGDVSGRADPLSPEEGLEMIYETLREGLALGMYYTSDFELPHAEAVNLQLPYVVVDEQNAAYSSHRVGRMPASAEAIADLQETSMEEGECSVCLMDFEMRSKIRAMPCSHCFHEQCIFTWLRLNHVCPLCRFPLPIERQQVG